MATVSLLATTSQAITLTLASLANAATNTSNAIDNSTAGFIRATVQVKVKTGASGTSTSGYLNVWLLRSYDNGSSYDDPGSVLLGQIAVTANAATYTRSFSTDVDSSFWKVAVENQSGGALDATAGSHSIGYVGIRYTIA